MKIMLDPILHVSSSDVAIYFMLGNVIATSLQYCDLAGMGGKQC